MKLHYNEQIEEGYDEDMEQTHQAIPPHELNSSTEDLKEDPTLKDTLLQSHYGTIYLTNSHV